jgi:hypothetical protein
MKKFFTLLIIALALPLVFAAFSAGDKSGPLTDTYIVIAWNDLGMHCSNKDFSNMCVLPPYNNQSVHVILKGSTLTPPTVMGPGSGIHVTYEIPGNTYSVGKTNFWTYVQHLFGVTLAPNIGLTGLGLTGTMADSSNFFHAQGIPLTPYTDANLTQEDPYQLTLIQAWDAQNNLLGSTQSVIPVSNEINCVSSGCHTSELQILQNHEDANLVANKPVLCASCHADPVLGTTGTGEAGYFSRRMHQLHGSHTDDCYKCHPGPNTQCFRDIMHTGGMVCQDCHGSVSNVGNTIANGRIPWFQEPDCGTAACHGPNFAPEPGKLFRVSHGHGNLLCSTCHGSPHAIYPTSQPRDNQQIIALQGYAGTLNKCEVCHGYIPSGPGPHGFNPLGIKPVSGVIPDKDEILMNYPNPFSYMTSIPFRISKAGWVSLDLLDLNGQKVQTIINETLQAGEYRAEAYASKLSSGTYICALTANGNKEYRKVIVVK